MCCVDQEIVVLDHGAVIHRIPCGMQMPCRAKRHASAFSGIADQDTQADDDTLACGLEQTALELRR